MSGVTRQLAETSASYSRSRSNGIDDDCRSTSSARGATAERGGGGVGGGGRLEGGKLTRLVRSNTCVVPGNGIKAERPSVVSSDQLLGTKAVGNNKNNNNNNSVTSPLHRQRLSVLDQPRAVGIQRRSLSFYQARPTETMATAAVVRPLGKTFNFSANIDVCVECEGRVYPVEKMVAGQCVYHKWCFRCAKCNSVLGVNNYAIAGAGIPYCKPHFTATFKQRGNFSDFAVKRVDENTAEILTDNNNDKTDRTTGSTESAAVDSNPSRKWIHSTTPRPLNPVNRVAPIGRTSNVVSTMERVPETDAETDRHESSAFPSANPAADRVARFQDQPNVDPTSTRISVRDVTANFEARTRIVSV